jgi:choline dehydrogenase-like flavoprotein
MATKSVDVLVIGAGVAGAAVANRCVGVGMSVVCLEQGDWTERSEYPGNKPKWELLAAKQWSSAPSIRDAPSDYPIDLTSSDFGVLNFNGVG